MGGIGTTELIVILVVALVIFGPSKLPELGKMAGRTIGSFKKQVNSIETELMSDVETKEEIKEEQKKEEQKKEEEEKEEETEVQKLEEQAS